MQVNLTIMNKLMNKLVNKLMNKFVNTFMKYIHEQMHEKQKKHFKLLFIQKTKQKVHRDTALMEQKLQQNIPEICHKHAVHGVFRHIINGQSSSSSSSSHVHVQSVIGLE